MTAPGTTSRNWEVTFFTVQTTSLDPTAGSLFANGRMPVPIDILIKANYTDNHHRHRLLKSELNSIQLVEYNNPNRELTGPWSYSSQENEFAHSLPSSGVTVSSPMLNDDSPDHQRYWVTTTSTLDIRVGARIMQPDGTRRSTHNGSVFDSHVHLTRINPVRYNTTTINVYQEAVAQGTYLTRVFPSSGERPYEHQDLWNQVNYYVSTMHYPGHAIVGVEISLNIHVNQKKNALCLTRMSFENRDRPWTSWIHVDRETACGFDLYDVYGNRGSFRTGHSGNRDEIRILNGSATISSTEQDDKHSPVVSQDGAPHKAKL